MISTDAVVIRNQLIDILTNWWTLENRDPAGPSDHELFERVRNVLLQDRKEREQHYSLPGKSDRVRHRDSNEALIDLRKEIRNAGQATNRKVRAKKGRKSNAEKDRIIADEYYAGRGEKWKGPSEYLKQRHNARYVKCPANARSWFSQLLKRDTERRESLNK